MTVLNWREYNYINTFMQLFHGLAWYNFNVEFNKLITLSSFWTAAVLEKSSQKKLAKLVSLYFPPIYIFLAIFRQTDGLTHVIGQLWESFLSSSPTWFGIPDGVWLKTHTKMQHLTNTPCLYYEILILRSISTSHLFKNLNHNYGNTPLRTLHDGERMLQKQSNVSLTCIAAGCNGFWNTKPTGCGPAHRVGEFLSMMFRDSFKSFTA